MTADQLRRFALAHGAELTIDGKPFNAERAQVAVPRAAPPAAAERRELPPPAAPPQESFTRAEVERMLADQEARLQAQFQTIAAMLKAATQPKPARPRIQSVVPTTNKDGAITLVEFKYHS